MLTGLISALISVAVMTGLLFLVLMVSEQNNKTMFRVWGAALGMTIIILMIL